MGTRSDDWRRKTLSDILGMSAQAPQPAGYELLIVLFVVPAAAPGRFLAISNYRKSIYQGSRCARVRGRTGSVVVTGSRIHTYFDEPRGRE